MTCVNPTSITRSVTQSRFSRVLDLCRRRALLIPGSEIYGGLASQYDYGPLATIMKNNLRQLWTKSFLYRRDCMPIESSIIMNRKVWETAGHVDHFADILVECRQCHHRYRLDHLLSDYKLPADSDQDPIHLYAEEMTRLQTRCTRSNCNGDLSQPRYFNMLFETSTSCSGRDQRVFLRPETAQGVYVNFHHLARSSRRTLPFGVGQIGKAFRNEISPGPSIFRTKEFEQAELQWFCEPGSDQKWHQYWIGYCTNWLFDLGIKSESIRHMKHEQLAHYAKATTDIEFNFGFDNDDDGWGELWGISNRGDHDLLAHQKASRQNMNCRQQDGNECVPYVIEPALGLDRLLLALLIDSFHQDTINGRQRNVLKLDWKVAPYQVAVFPIVANNVQLRAFSDRMVDRLLAANIRTDYDCNGSIGRRYRRHDEIGTPVCITVDDQTLQDDTVTVRSRDNMEQHRLHSNDLLDLTSAQDQIRTRLHQ